MFYLIVFVVLIYTISKKFTPFSFGEMPKKINANQKTDKSNSNNICNKLTKKAKKKKAYFIKNKEIQKQLTNDNELVKKGNETKNVTKGVLLRNITHKESVGCNNWKKFIEMENCNQKNKSKNISNPNKTEKLPLMKSGSLNENNTFLSSLFTFRRPKQQPKITKVIGMDCEMVGVGENGSVSIVARVSLVNSFGECIYDKYVKPTETVTDYRTFVSGIRPHHLEGGEDFFTVQKEVANLLKGRTLVGHALKHDLQVLILRHPRKYIRDTTTFLKFRREAKGTLSLKNLSKEFLNVKIQHGEHDSIEDARAAMQLYMTYRKEWEQERREKWLATKSSKKPVVSDVVCETI